MKKIITIAILLTTVITANAQKFDELAKTPPMGWNSWNKFQCDISEKLIRETADAVVSTGLKDAGYIYVNIDDCWHGTRDVSGFIQPDAKRFPSGMKALADYVHSKGLKIGIYSDCGNQTCGGRPGSRGHEYQDALTYAQWGIDYLKYDWCHAEDLKAPGAYATMRDAIHEAGRPMVFSLCEWGDNKPWLWASNVGHLWRTTGDITACFDCILDHKTWHQSGVLQILDLQKPIRQYAGPGHWNDPDMLEVGNGMSTTEDRAHFTLWCMLSAPLILGNDLQNMNTETMKIISNPRVIALDQDADGIEAFPQSESKGVEFWFKPLSGGDWAFCALNRTTNSADFNFDWKTAKVADESFSKREAHLDTTVYALHDLWADKDAGTTTDALQGTLAAHDVLVLRLTAKK